MCSRSTTQLLNMRTLRLRHSIARGLIVVSLVPIVVLSGLEWSKILLKKVQIWVVMEEYGFPLLFIVESWLSGPPNVDMTW